MCVGFKRLTRGGWHILASIALGWAWPALAADSPAVVSIRQSLRDASPAQKSPLLLELSRALDSDTDAALAAARDARQAAAGPHDELMADARISTLERRAGDLAGAFTTAHRALERATELHDDAARAELLLAQARANWSLGDSPGTMAAHQQLIALATQLGNRTLVGRGHLGLSVMLAEMGEQAKAREEEEIALRIAREVGDRELESDALNNLGNNYRTAGDLAGARSFHEQSRAIRDAIGNRRGVGDSWVNLSEISRFERNYPQALAEVEHALAIYQEIGLPRSEATAHLQACAILRESGRIDEALARARAGFTLAGSIGSPALTANFQAEFAALAAAKGDWQAAYQAERKRAAAADQTLGEKSRQRMAGLNARYEADRRHQEIERLSAERARQVADLRAKEAELNASTAALQRSNTTRVALGVSLFSLTIALGAVIALQRVRLRAERRILEQARSARDLAEEADRIKTRFLGIASHDIRAPLGNIVNLTADLRTTKADSELIAERCDLIGSEAQRVISLVEDLITTAALETGKLELRPAPMDLRETTRQAIESLHWQAEAKRQRIEFPEPALGVGRIVGDAARLHQVVANLLGNAIKFSPPGETISVSLERRASALELAVRDRGAGIAEKDIPRLFAPFQRLATHPTAGESSHGLGLSIAQEIVRRHGGQILVTSQPGAGSVFVVSLPLEAPAGSAQS